MGNILKIDQVKELAEKLHQKNKTIVLTGGCFDLLHFGHITLFEQAKNKGDILIVLLESDERIKLLKGRNRPLHSQKQRAHMLSAIKYIDYVVLLTNKMTDQGYNDIVKQILPDIIATTEGSESIKYIYSQAKNVGAEVLVIKKIDNLSSSKIVDIITKEI